MRTSLYLIVNSKGTARVVKQKWNRPGPSTGPDEIALGLEVNLPDALFKKPRLEAKVTVPDHAVAPSVISAEVADNIKEAIKSATGVDVTIKVVSHDCDEKENEETK